MARRYNSNNRVRLDGALADHGPEERWQHGQRELVLTRYAGVLAARALEECALDRWLMVGAISPSEHEAGLQLRRDYVAGQVPAQVTNPYSGLRFGRGGAWRHQAERRSEKAEAAYQRWRAAIRAVGPVASVVLIAVCCEDGALAWQRRFELRDALQLLERCYK